MRIDTRLITTLLLLVATAGCGGGTTSPEPVAQQQPPVQLAQQPADVPPAQVNSQEMAKQEARDFIADKCKHIVCNVTGGGTQVYDRHDTSLSFKHDGTLVIHEKFEYLSGPQKGVMVISVDEVVLKDLNPRRVKLGLASHQSSGFDSIDMTTTGEIKSIKSTLTSGPNDDTPEFVKKNYVYFMLNQGERTHQQLVKAFTQLIELEGGKPDRFED